MALGQHEDRSQPAGLHSDHGKRFTCEAYQQFLAGHNLVCSMSAIGHCRRQRRRRRVLRDA